MLVLLSPARNIRPQAIPGVRPERPLFLAQAAELAKELRQRDSWQLESLLDLSPERALEMYAAYQMFSPEQPGTPALTSYYGAAYRCMNPIDFSKKELAFAQDTLRMLSALYGVLRPFDGILPHRLGLGKEFRIDGMDLYSYWGDRISREIFRTGEQVINLASMDYAKLLNPRREMFTCRFVLRKPDGLRGTVSTVRAARGMMARYIVKNRIKNPEELREFDLDGYRFAPAHSDSLTYTFVKEPEWIG
ncbi:MAG: YaaA family protein [Oscillospiraceae bacterium]